MDLLEMGLSSRAGLVFGLNREKNIPQNESEGLGLDMSPWRVQCELHPPTNRAVPQTWLQAPFVSQFQPSPTAGVA